MDNSKYALCPRGTGPTSYRIYEAIQMGCVPVYIGDNFWLPFSDELNWFEFCCFLHVKHISALDCALSDVGLRYDKMQARLAEVYKSHFSQDACCEQISRRIEQL
jgi:hypothetical protein